MESTCFWYRRHFASWVARVVRFRQDCSFSWIVTKTTVSHASYLIWLFRNLTETRLSFTIITCCEYWNKTITHTNHSIVATSGYCIARAAVGGKTNKIRCQWTLCKYVKRLRHRQHCTPRTLWTWWTDVKARRQHYPQCNSTADSLVGDLGVLC